MTEIPHVSVAVIGGSQAGLSMSYYLSANAIDHVVFEKNRVAPCLAHAALGQLLPRHSELAMQTARLRLPRQRSGRFHGP